MKRILAAVGLAAIGAAGLPAGKVAHAAACVTTYSIAFDIHPIGGGGPPANVAGSICTDGTVGPIWAGNIASWNLSLTNSYNPTINDFVLDSTSPTADLNDHLVGTTTPLSATATELTWTFADPGSGNYAILEFTDTASNFALSWYNYNIGFTLVRNAYALLPSTISYGSEQSGPQIFGTNHHHHHAGAGQPGAADGGAGGAGAAAPGGLIPGAAARLHGRLPLSLFILVSSLRPSDESV